MPPGRMTSRSARVSRSGSEPWKPRKKSCPTFSSSVRRLSCFICSLLEFRELPQRLHRREVVYIQRTKLFAQLFFHCGEQSKLIDGDPGLSLGANREIIRHLMFVLLMFFEDFPRPA